MHQTLIPTVLIALMAHASISAADTPACPNPGCAATAGCPAKPAATDLGAWKIAVVIPKPAVAGKMLDVDFTLTPTTPAPKAVRIWVGAANGRGSVKAKAEPEAPGAYCVGVEVPEPLPADAQVWIAAEAADGTMSKTSVALPTTPAAPK